jgi:hypothetical protein
VVYIKDGEEYQQHKKATQHWDERTKKHPEDSRVGIARPSVKKENITITIIIHGKPNKDSISSSKIPNITR